MEIIGQINSSPTFGNSFGNGWNVMKKYFLVLFLVVIVVALITGPSQILRMTINPDHHNHWNHWNDWNNWHDWSGLHFSHLGMLAFGVVAIFTAIVALAYTLLIVPVFRYGARMIFVQAVRNTRPDLNLLVQGFRENYLGVVLASLLVFSLVVVGFILLVIPGIIIACRLAFVGYLVMDKKLDPIMAVEESWKMTRGHGWTIFFMAIASFFIFIAGFCLLFVGIFPACMWVASSFASLYESILAERSPL